MQLKCNGTGATTASKNEVFIWLLQENYYLVGSIKIWWEHFFLVEGNEQTFG